MAGHAFGTLLGVPSLGEPWPNWWTELPGGQLGQMLTILVVGDAAYGDKRTGVISVIREVIVDASRLNPNVRLRFLVSPQAGTIMLELVTLPTWATILQAIGSGSLSLDQVSNPLEASPDLTLFFWDPRRRCLDLIKLAHEGAGQGIITRCYAFTGQRTVGPVPLPSLPAAWTGGQGGCPLSL